VKSVTDLEIEEAIREAWTMVQAGAPPSARRLAAALLAVTGGTQAHPHWVTPDDLWRDRLAILADQGAWLAGELGSPTGGAGLPGAARPAAGNPSAARERLFPVAFGGANRRRQGQREQHRTPAAIPAPG